MDDGREDAERVLLTVRQLEQRIADYSRQLSRDVGLTVPQLMCIKAIGLLNADGVAVTLATLAAQVQLSAATTSRIVERLLRAGLLERARDPRDRRRVSLTLTSAGQALYAALPSPLHERFVRRLAALPANERAELLACLQRLVDLMTVDGDDLDPSEVDSGQP